MEYCLFCNISNENEDVILYANHLGRHICLKCINSHTKYVTNEVRSIEEIQQELDLFITDKLVELSVSASSYHKEYVPLKTKRVRMVWDDRYSHTTEGAWRPDNGSFHRDLALARKTNSTFTFEIEE